MTDTQPCPQCQSPTMRFKSIGNVAEQEPVICECWACGAAFELTPRTSAPDGGYPLAALFVLPSTPFPVLYAWEP
jgi:hypothetical protein